MTICVPAADLFVSPDVFSEHTDEALFGTGCEIIDEFGGFYRIKTYYGYTGWTEKRCVSEELHPPTACVVSPFSDLLPRAENKYAPVMTLPRGSMIDYGAPHPGERWGVAVMPDKKGLFIHTETVAPIPGKRADFRDRIVSAARSYLGVQYRWGGKTPAGIDCSGLAFMAYFFAGITIWRDADPERNDCLTGVPLSAAGKGDLLFYPGHVAIYLGGDRFIHSCGAHGVCEGSFAESPSMKNDIIYIGTAK